MSMDWRDVGAVPGYQVNEKGDVRRYGKPTLLSQYKTASGYLQVKLTHQAKSSSHLVHRLVADAFLQHDETTPTVNHKNHVKTDNRLENLEWMSAREQNIHKRKRKGPLHGTERAVCSLTMTDRTDVTLYASARAAAAAFNRHKGSKITAAVRTGKSAYGYFWRYGDQDTTLPGEEWQLLPAERVGVTGFMISSRGRLKTNRGRICTAKPRTNGYLGTKIAGKVVSMHRLVAEAFIPRQTGKNVVNHIDGDKHNAAATNLEWTDNAGNARHAAETGLRQGLRAVAQFTRSGVAVASYPSIALAGRKTGLFGTSIQSACQQTRYTAGGFYWRYACQLAASGPPH